MAELRQTLEHEEILDEFDRVVFESIIDRVLVGGYNEETEARILKTDFCTERKSDRCCTECKSTV